MPSVSLLLSFLLLSIISCLSSISHASAPSSGGGSTVVGIPQDPLHHGAIPNTDAASAFATTAAAQHDNDPLSLSNHPDVVEKLKSKGLDPSIAQDSQHIYTKENDVFRNVEFDEAATATANPTWRQALNELFKQYRPKFHPLWQALKNSPASLLTNPGWLAEFYKRYQAAMHVTRVMVFKTPNLSSPDQRKRLLAVLGDDDSQTNRSHHNDLQRLFEDFGASRELMKPQEWFHDPEEMVSQLDSQTAGFFRGVMLLYPSSTGAWTIAEMLSDEWLSTLADGFSRQFPWVAKHDYFDEIFTGHVEIRHMMETVTLSEEVFARYPHKLETTINHSRQMCELLNGLWDNLHGLVLRPEAYLSVV